MKTFEELNRAKNAGACAYGYKMGLESKNKADLLKAITANWFWVLRTEKIVDASFLDENFTEEELNEAGIYTRGYNEVSTTSFACGSATVKACDSATVKAYDSATVEVPISISNASCILSRLTKRAERIRKRLQTSLFKRPICAMRSRNWMKE